MSGRFYAGDVYFNRLDAAGQPTGLINFGNTPKLSITEAADEKLRSSAGRDTYGQALDAVYVKKPTEIAIMGDEMDAANLAIGLLGTVSLLSQATATVTAEAVAAVKLDTYSELANGNVSAVVVSDTGGTPVYVEGTDYVVNASVGMIKPLSTGSITDGSTLSVAYTAGVISGNRIAGGTQPTVKGQIIMDGIDLATQREGILRIDQAVLTPNKALDILGGNFLGLELKGRLLLLPGKAQPYVFDDRA